MCMSIEIQESPNPKEHWTLWSCSSFKYLWLLWDSTVGNVMWEKGETETDNLLHGLLGWVGGALWPWQWIWWLTCPCGCHQRKCGSLGDVDLMNPTSVGWGPPDWRAASHWSSKAHPLPIVHNFSRTWRRTIQAPLQGMSQQWYMGKGRAACVCVWGGMNGTTWKLISWWDYSVCWSWAQTCCFAHPLQIAFVMSPWVQPSSMIQPCVGRPQVNLQSSTSPPTHVGTLGPDPCHPRASSWRLWWDVGNGPSLSLERHWGCSF